MIILVIQESGKAEDKCYRGMDIPGTHFPKDYADQCLSVE